MQTVPAGPGLSRFRCVCDGRDTVLGRVGPSAAARDRPHPRAGLRALGPRPGPTGTGPAASSPASADARTRSRVDARWAQTRPLARSGRAARRAGDPDNPPRGRRHPRSSASDASCLGVADGPRAGWLRCLPGVRSNSLGARGRCRAAAPSPELPRSRTSSLARTPREAGRRSGLCPARRRSLRPCARPSTDVNRAACRLCPALRCVWRRTRRDRPAGQQDYVGERALTPSSHPSLACLGVSPASRRASTTPKARRDRLGDNVPGRTM